MGVFIYVSFVAESYNVELNFFCFYFDTFYYKKYFRLLLEIW